MPLVQTAGPALERKADVSFDVEPRRLGRTISGFAFKVRKNTPAKRARKPATAPEASEMDETTRKAHKAALAKLRADLGKPAPTAK